MFSLNDSDPQYYFSSAMLSNAWEYQDHIGQCQWRWRYDHLLHSTFVLPVSRWSFFGNTYDFSHRPRLSDTATMHALLSGWHLWWDIGHGIILWSDMNLAWKQRQILSHTHWKTKQMEQCYFSDILGTQCRDFLMTTWVIFMTQRWRTDLVLLKCTKICLNDHISKYSETLVLCLSGASMSSSISNFECEVSNHSMIFCKCDFNYAASYRRTERWQSTGLLIWTELEPNQWQTNDTPFWSLS